MKDLLLPLLLMACFSWPAIGVAGPAGAAREEFQALRQELTEVSQRVDFAQERQEEVRSAIADWRQNATELFAFYSKRGLDRRGWSRLEGGLRKEAGKLKKSLRDHVHESQHEDLDRMVDVMSDIFVAQQRFAMARQRRQGAGER